MASITDCVVEGLKYPFNDVKKVVCFGVLFAILNLLSIARGIKSLDIVRAFSKAPGDTLMLKFSQMPPTDLYVMAALSIVAFIIMLFVMGYQYNVVKFAIDKKEDLPGFGDILGIFVKGVKYFIVTLAYNIIPSVLLVAGVILTANQAYGGILIAISMILFIVAFFILIMALNNMVAHDSVAKAFDFKEITERISNLGWGKYIGIIIFTLVVFMIIMVAVGFILSLLTTVLALAINNAVILSAIMGIIEGLFVTSYGGIFYNRVLGSIYRESIN